MILSTEKALNEQIEYADACDVPFETILEGQPCDHRGCLSHQSHPCEGCGRVGGKGYVFHFSWCEYYA